MSARERTVGLEGLWLRRPSPPSLTCPLFYEPTSSPPYGCKEEWLHSLAAGSYASAATSLPVALLHRSATQVEDQEQAFVLLVLWHPPVSLPFGEY